MSCLRIKLPPAKKAWKIFTSKLQTKLHKLQKPSKTITKPQNRLHIKPTQLSLLHNTSTTTTTTSTNKQLIRSSNHRFRFSYKPKPRTFKKKTAAPVYVDKLFKDPKTNGLMMDCTLHVQPKAYRKDTMNVEKGKAKAVVVDEGYRKTADDLWESVGLASPLMHGIDDRAEEFITKFRAEMELQEMMTRHL